VLTDSGLLDAIEAQAARLPIPVTINASRNLRGVRFPADIEDAAWYGLAEAMTNALKHSTATRLDVRLAQVSGRLELEVADDGSGFDPPQAARFGLTALADRMAVLGGQLVVESAPGDGARVRMLLPLPAPTEGDGRCASSSPTTAT
jgi:signal transduction histidine kinase